MALNQTHSYLSTFRWLAESTGWRHDVVVVRADAIFQREMPLSGWLVDAAAPATVIAPWYVGSVFGKVYNNYSAIRGVRRFSVRAVCDAVLFVRSSDLPSVINAIEAMGRVPDYLTYSSMHFLPWYAQTLVTTAYEMPAHDSNPSKEWNPLYALPSRPASTTSRAPWVLSTDMDQEVDTW